MSMITCLKCKYKWDGTTSPFCPMCNIKSWENDSGFLRPKHDPTKLPLVMEDDRSVVTWDCVTDLDVYINENELARKGQYYYDANYKNYTCVLNQPLGTTAGSIVPAGYDWPTKGLDAQKVVDIFGEPHVYAVKYSTIRYEVAIGRLIKPLRCSVDGCHNWAVPNTSKCKRH